MQRTKNTVSQTILTKTQRKDNVKDAFVFNSNEVGDRSHFLLVDDVLTTGATLESCIKTIFENTKDIRASLAVIGEKV